MLMRKADVEDMESCQLCVALAASKANSQSLEDVIVSTISYILGNVAELGGHEAGNAILCNLCARHRQEVTNCLCNAVQNEGGDPAALMAKFGGRIERVVRGGAEPN